MKATTKRTARPARTKRAKDPATRALTDSRPTRLPFPVVGVGASTGGLEALEKLLTHLPANSNVAVVIVQHLEPTEKGMLVELLQHATPLPVLQITDQMRVEEGHVYVIPPNKDLSIVHGVLHLLAPVAARGSWLPIDFFFRSLADDRKERSLGVILSGTGSDGTLGVRAIRERGGAVFVQEPASATFDSMPRSAIEAGVADVVAPAPELPAKIVSHLTHARRTARTSTDVSAQGALDKIIGLLRSATGHDFSHYKTSTIQRRIERRMGLHQIGDVAKYIRYLRENPREAQLLFDELLIGVTSFFRDAPEWERLKDVVLPELIARRSGPLKAWVAGCSTGEEAYSLAIAFKEALERDGATESASLQIFATDLDAAAITKARLGVYPANIAADVSPARLSRFFETHERGYRVKKELRNMVVFAPQNVVQDPPFTKLDVLTCRNLLIYLTPTLQQKLIPLFHYCLKPSGVLVLGSAENIGHFTDLFGTEGGRTRIYRRLSGMLSPIELPAGSFRVPVLPRAASEPPKAKEPDAPPTLQTQADHLLLRRFAPDAVVTSRTGDVLYASGRTGKYLEVPAGKANWNVFAMAPDDLRLALTDAFRRALRTKATVTFKSVTPETNGVTRTIRVVVEPVDEPPAMQGTVVIVFTDLPPPITAKNEGGQGRGSSSSRDRLRIGRLEQELSETREAMQTSQEELRSANEEMRSTNEELQSTNEELQSTNEELTTSKEEMQSMNEELQMLNHELQAKLDELSRAGNDMKNLLDSTEIATIFLDDSLNVRRFTPQATTLFKLIPNDVGRPLADLASVLVYPEIYDDSREVLRTLVFRERVVSAGDGRAFNVRIMPYRTSDNQIDGLVITFMKIPGTPTHS